MYKIDKITTPNLMFYCYFNDTILALIRIDGSQMDKSTSHFLEKIMNASIGQSVLSTTLAYLKKTENGLAYIPKFVTCQNMSVVNVVVRKDSYLSLVSLRCYHNTS